MVEPSIDDDSFWKLRPFTYDKLDYYTSMVDLCFALVIPERLQTQGIRSISAVAEAIGIKISPPGYLYLNYDIKEHHIFYDTWLNIILDYQINNFLKIGNEDCNPDPSFNRDDCVFKQLVNVSTLLYIDNFGATYNHESTILKKELLQSLQQTFDQINFSAFNGTVWMFTTFIG